MNKSILFAIATAVLAFAATPAMADSFTGPRVTATAGYQDVTNVPANHSFNYGVEAGYDAKLVGPVTVGVEAGLSNIFDRSDINVGGRVGYELNNHALLYAGAAYDNFRDFNARSIKGAVFTGGVEVNVVGPVSVGAQYQYHDLGSTHKNAVAATATLRF